MVVGAGGIEPRILAADAGRVDEMRDRPERLRRLVEDAHDVVLLRHVALQRDGFAAGFLYRVATLSAAVGVLT